MKSYIWLISCLLVSTLSTKAQNYKILESNSEYIKIEFNFENHYKIKDTLFEGRKYSLITGDNFAFRKPGEPWLPAVYLNIGIPFNSNPQIKILSLDQNNISQVFIIPYPDSLNQPIENLNFDEAIYSSNYFFPKQAAEIGSTFIMRYSRMAGLMVSPYQYNPVRREVIFNKKIVVRIDYSYDQNIIQSFTRINDQLTDDIIKSSVVNPKEAINFTGKLLNNTFTPLSSDTTWYNPQKDYYKIYLKEKGVYRISFENLVSSGVPLGDGIPSSKLEIYNMGEQIPLDIHDNNDSIFQVGDYFQFIGYPPPSTAFCAQNIYNRSNVYWFSYEGNGTRRYDAINGYADAWDTTIQTTRATIHYEVDSLYERLGHAPDMNRDYWLWGSSSGMRGNYLSVFNHNFTTFQNWDQDSLNFILRTKMQGMSTLNGNPDHNIKIRLTGQLVDSIKWDGQTDITTETYIDVDPIFIYPVTQLQIFADGNIPDADSSDEIRINWYEIDYWMSHKAFLNNFYFTSTKNDYGEKVFSVYNWKRDTLWIYIPQRGKIIQNARFLNNEFDEILFKDSINEQTEYYCVAPDYFLTPDSILKDNSSTLHQVNNGADYIIITHKNFYEAAERLANYRATNLSGFSSPRIKIVDVQDIYDEFSFGLLNPYSLRDFVKYAFENWSGSAPQYIVLLGDMSYDYRRILISSRPNFIPSIPFRQSTYGQAASDNSIVTVAGDDPFPDLAIGRLSCETLQEANILLDKIINYPADQDKSWKENVLLISSGQNLADENYFGFNDTNLRLENTFIKPTGYTDSKVFRYPNKPEHVPFQGSGPEVRQKFNEGCVIANFYGHGGGYQWDLMFLNDDIYLLENGDKLPFISSVTCYTAHFDNQDVFGEQFNKVPGKGSIAFWGSSGLTYWSTGYYLNEQLFNQIFSNNEFVLGDAILLALSGVFNEQISLFTLLGDPALELALPKHPDFSITSSDISYFPNFPLTNDTMSFKLKIKNLGRIFPQDTAKISFFISSPDTSYLVEEKYLLSFGQNDSINFYWTPTIGGEYNIRFEINKDNSIQEEDLSDNIAELSIFVFNLNEPNIVKPIDGLSTTNQNIIFIFSDIGHYIDRDLKYHIQIDTSLSFSNPILQDSLIVSLNGIVRWMTPQLSNGVYFWRTRLLNDSSYSNWTITRSFNINSNSREGFYSSENQMKLFSFDNILYSDSLKSSVLNTSFNPPKPANARILDTIKVNLPADIPYLTSSTTDGKFIYFASMAYYSSTGKSKIYKLGTGEQGTIKGELYGAIPGVEISIWHTIFYNSDGFIYAATGDSASLLKINPVTGDTSRIQLPDGMINERGAVKNGAFYLCTDGRYVYNLAYQDTLGNRKYVLRIIDPQNGWFKVGEDKTLTGSSYVGFVGFFVAHGYFYPYENFDGGYMRRINISTLVFEEEWKVDDSFASFQSFYSWSYDWTNDIIYASTNNPGKPPMFFKFIGRYKNASGNIITQIIGPALEWNNLNYEIEKTNSQSIYNVYLDGFNSSLEKWDTLGLFPPDTSLNNIVASEYPYLRLRISFFDSSLSGLYPLRLKNIYIKYKSLPEITLSKNYFSYFPDSVLQGFPITMKTKVNNIGYSTADSVSIAFYSNGSDSAFYKTTVTNINPDSLKEIEYEIQTSSLSPATTYSIKALATVFDSEFYNFNNTAPSNFFVARDSINPSFTITVDGKEIINGDIISPNPEIVITLKDNSPLPLDTSLFTIIYTHDKTSEPLGFYRPDLQYTYTPYPNSQSTIKWNPKLPDGKHTLEILAKDASGNFFDTTSSRTFFYVFNTPDLKNVYNYPNPFKEDTYFTFELSSILPQQLYIRIYTVAGRLIRNIDVPQNLLNPGFNRIPWDGRDQDGDEVANGVYFYKIVAKINDVIKTETQKLAKVK